MQRNGVLIVPNPGSRVLDAGEQKAPKIGRTPQRIRGKKRPSRECEGEGPGLRRGKEKKGFGMGWAERISVPPKEKKIWGRGLDITKSNTLAPPPWVVDL